MYARQEAAVQRYTDKRPAVAQNNFGSAQHLLPSSSSSASFSDSLSRSSNEYETFLAALPIEWSVGMLEKMRTRLLWVFPVISITVWLAMLLAMLIHWCVIGRPVYISEDPGQTIAFISDVGASSIKPLFIVGCCITTISLDLSLFAERWLWFQYESREEQSKSDRVCGILSIGFAIIGSFGLILLSILDVVHHRVVHQSLLILALAGYIISAAFLCWERRQLRKDFSKHYVQSVAFYTKTVFVALETVLIIAFIVCFARYEDPDAVFEWVIAFLFALYASAFLIDLLPVARKGTKGAHATENEIKRMARTSTNK